MLAIDLELLTDRFMATRYNDRDLAEWPPEPARLFSALVEALHAGDADPVEASALDWLAQRAAPLIYASEAHRRRVMVHYVPVNDADVVGGGDFSKHQQKVDDAEALLVDALQAMATARTKAQVTKAERAHVRAEKKRAKARQTLQAAIVKRATGGRAGTPKWNHPCLPDHRTKKDRTFPAVLPHHPVVRFAWPDAHADVPTSAALRTLAARVARVGHSSSFVRLAVYTADPPSAAGEDTHSCWVPDPDGEEVLRVPLTDQRMRLEDAHAHHLGEAPGRVLPCSFARYTVGVKSAPVAATVRAGGRWISFSLEQGGQPPAASAVALTSAIRGAILAHASAPVHPILSGHGPDGPLRAEHLAFLALPFVAHPHADGLVRGFALQLPAGASEEADRQLLRAVGRWEDDQRRVSIRLAGGAHLVAERIVDPEDALQSLRQARWAGPSRRWASITPIALDGECVSFHHPAGAMRRKARKTAQKLIRRAVARAVQGSAVDADAVAVSLVFDAPVMGAAVLGAVRPYRRDGHPRPRRLVHAVIELPVAVRGPLVIGAGRHLGLGLCVPLSSTPGAGQ